VWDTERAFAKTMADRDFAAFGKFLSAETVFQGGKAPLRGPDAVNAAWKKFYEGPQAPFSWEPDNVLVMTDGKLAISSGPVRDPQGKLVARFNSVWRQEAPGVWRIVLDMGNDACECSKPTQ
jgi:ketosteroid isomerase-like protein